MYIHVPFCRARCDYCEFESEAVGVRVASSPEAGERGGRLDPPPDADVGGAESAAEAALARRFDTFIAAVHAEWARECELSGVRRLETVYVGGGTPSLLGEERLERLLEPLRPLLTPKAEVTVETNPEDASGGYAAWAAARRLRISLGVQSFDERLRENLGRRAAADPAAAFVRLRDAGVASLGIDLIFGIPGQSLADVERELAAVAKLRPDHVSWYELTPAEGTALAARERLELPGEEVQAEMYRRIVAGLERLGYRWYEVSNFALPGHRCRHNSACWRGREFLGLGPAAVSTIGAERRRNAAAVGPYCDALLGLAGRRGARLASEAPRGGASAPPRTTECLDPETRARERLFLAARTGAPVPLAQLAAALDETALGPLADAGFVAVHGGTLRVTRKGRYVASAVCVRLFRASSS